MKRKKLEAIEVPIQVSTVATSPADPPFFLLRASLESPRRHCSLTIFNPRPYPAVPEPQKNEATHTRVMSCAEAARYTAKSVDGPTTPRQSAALRTIFPKMKKSHTFSLCGATVNFRRCRDETWRSSWVNMLHKRCHQCEAHQ